MGVLVSIAWPSYRQYQARSRQVEAKAELSNLYLAMQAFHAEWQVHVGAFGPIGYTPEGEFRYNVGFETKFKDKFCGGQDGMDMDMGAVIEEMMKLDCGPNEERLYSGDVTTGCDFKTVAGESGHPNLKFVGADDLAADTVLMGVDPKENELDSTDSPGKIRTDVKAHSFIAGAAGDPLGLGAATADNRDAWWINQDKILKQNAGSKVDL